MASTDVHASSAALDARFPRSARLTLPTQFAAGLRVRAAHRAPRFALHVSVNTESSEWRLGLVIPKRFEASSVRRNTIRRAFREIFRRHRAQLSGFVPARDLVVRLHAKGAPAGLAEFKRLCAGEAAELFAGLVAKLSSAAAEATSCAAS